MTQLSEDYKDGFKKGIHSPEAEKHWREIFFKQLSPDELIESKLEEYKRDLEKSTKLYSEDKISVKTHLEHRENLGQLIRSYSYALNMLRTGKLKNDEKNDA